MRLIVSISMEGEMKERGTDTLRRQWEILKLIPRSPRKTTTIQLRDALEDAGYPTTLRTVQRDLEKLVLDFQITSDGFKPAGWCWAKDARQFDIPGMSTHAALVFKMVQRHLCHLLPEACLDLLGPYFEQAAKVLTDIQPQPMAAWPDKVAVLSRGLSLESPHIDPAVLFNVYHGLLTARQIKIMYRRRGEDHAEERDVNPLGLVVVDQVHYLIGTLWHYRDIKHLAIHRMESATVLDNPALVPDDFDLQAYAASGEFGYPAGQGTLKLKALFDDYTAQQFKESPLSPNQKLTEQKDGRVLVEAEMRDTAQLRWWLQGFGMAVEVVGPKKLREEFAAMSRQLARIYE
jgi:predicted DNA-binding transcriptional regulator YafY